MDPDRREFIKSAGSSVSMTTAVGVTALSGVAAAAVDYRTKIPEDVYLTFDRDIIKTVEPFLDVGDVKIMPSEAWSLIATTGDSDPMTTGDDWDTNVVVTFVSYPVQTGLTSADSHLGDKEPIYVEYKPTDTGPEPVRVLWDAYHWLREQTTTFPVATGPDNRNHPTYKIANKYHFYLPIEEKGVFLSDEVGLGDLRNELQGWLDNGWPVHIPAITNPWIMRRRSSWWEEGRLGIRVMEKVYQRAYDLGILGAERSAYNG